MQTTITGKAYVLGDNVDTDQIIPAQYLTFNPSIPEEYKLFGKYALQQRAAGAGRACPRGTCRSTPRTSSSRDYKIIVGGKNFGCGSSREHAPIALAAAGIEAVVAEFYARIFFRNAVNGGYLVPFECAERLCDKICTGDELRIDVGGSDAAQPDDQGDWSLKPLGEVAILEAGGCFPTRKVGMLRRERTRFLTMSDSRSGSKDKCFPFACDLRRCGAESP